MKEMERKLGPWDGIPNPRVEAQRVAHRGIVKAAIGIAVSIEGVQILFDTIVALQHSQVVESPLMFIVPIVEIPAVLLTLQGVAEMLTGEKQPFVPKPL